MSAGKRHSAECLYARATLGAIAATAILTAAAALAMGEHRASLLAGGAITIVLHLITLAALGLARIAGGHPVAFGLGGYIVKLVALVVGLVALRAAGADMQVTVGMMAVTIAASLAVLAIGMARGRGPLIGDR